MASRLPSAPWFAFIAAAGYKFRRQHEDAQRAMAWEEGFLNAVVWKKRWVRYVVYYLILQFFVRVALELQWGTLPLELLGVAIVTLIAEQWIGGNRKVPSLWVRYPAYFFATLLVPLFSAVALGDDKILANVAWLLLTVAFVSFFVFLERKILKARKARKDEFDDDD